MIISHLTVSHTNPSQTHVSCPDMTGAGSSTRRSRKTPVGSVGILWFCGFLTECSSNVLERPPLLYRKSVSKKEQIDVLSVGSQYTCSCQVTIEIFNLAAKPEQKPVFRFRFYFGLCLQNVSFSLLPPLFAVMLNGANFFHASLWAVFQKILNSLCKLCELRFEGVSLRCGLGMMRSVRSGFGIVGEHTLVCL